MLVVKSKFSVVMKTIINNILLPSVGQLGQAVTILSASLSWATIAHKTLTVILLLNQSNFKSVKRMMLINNLLVTILRMSLSLVQ